MKGILAQKIGMTRMIDPETGNVVPVTVCEVPENKVLQVKTIENDGYAAIVLGTFERKKGKNIGKKYKMIKEVQLEDGEEMKKNDVISIDNIKDIKSFKITGTSKGCGFAGVIKRHNFSRGPETHGSHHHREPGSIGTCAKPARVIKGKAMPGQLGNAQTTIRSVELVDVDLKKNLIAIKGPVPGAKKSYVFLREK